MILVTLIGIQSEKSLCFYIQKLKMYNNCRTYKKWVVGR